MGLPRVMAEGKTPEKWVAELAAAGINVSGRTLRERARSLGAYRTLGQAMVLLPEHIDQIFEEPPCRSTAARYGISVSYAHQIATGKARKDVA